MYIYGILSRLHDATICCSSPFPLTHDPLLGFPILFLRLGDHIFWQPNVLHILLSLANQPVPYVLLIEGVLSSSGSISVCGPVTRRIGCKDLVDEDKSRRERLRIRGGWKETEFELGFGENDTSGFGMGCSLGYGVQAERDLA